MAMIYQPKTAIVNVHNSTRFGGESNVFTSDFATTSSPGFNYLKGIVGLTGVYIAVGIVLFVALGITYIVGCCKGRKLRLAAHDKPKKHHGCFARFVLAFINARAWYVICFLAMAGMAAAVLANVVNARNGASDGLTHIMNLSNTFTSCSNTLTGPVSANLADCISAAQALQTSNPQTAVQEALTDCQIAAGISTNTASSLSTFQSSFFQKVTSNSGYFSVNNITYNAMVGSVTVLSLFIAWTLLVIIPVLPKRFCCATFFRVCSGFIVVIMLGVYIFTGLLMTVVFVGSDICVDPPAAINNIVVNNGASNPMIAGNITATVNYYAYCSNPATQTAGLPANLDALNYWTTAAKSAANMVIAAPGDANLAKLKTATASALTATTQAQAATTCTVVNPEYVQTVDFVCNTGIADFAAGWIILTAGCCLMFIVIISTARMLFDGVPGDAADPLLKKEQLQPTVMVSLPAYSEVPPQPMVAVMPPSPVGSPVNMVGGAASPAMYAGASNWQ